jgi:ATP-dependent DNA helicase DinG
VTAFPPTLDLAPALVVLPGPRAGMADGGGEGRILRAPDARDLFEHGPVLVAHAAMTARRLNLSTPSRHPRLFDVLELYAFARPATFCAPSAVGLAMALGLVEPHGAAEQAQSLRESADALLRELALTPVPSREEALAIAETLARAGWAWGPAAIGALRSAPVGNAFRGSGLDVWTRTGEWEDQAPLGESGTRPIDPHAAADRLKDLLVKAGLKEERPTQSLYAAEAAFAFQPREREGEPRVMLAEAGTGHRQDPRLSGPGLAVGRGATGAVWVSTYTRALQRQIDRESRQPLSRSPPSGQTQGRGPQGPRELPLPAEPSGDGQGGPAGQRRPDRPSPDQPAGRGTPATAT